MPRIDLLVGRFPRHELAIRRLYLRDPGFRAVCDDYREVRRALEHWQAPEQVVPGRVAEYRHVLEELEAEALAFLHASGGAERGRALHRNGARADLAKRGAGRREGRLLTKVWTSRLLGASLPVVLAAGVALLRLPSAAFAQDQADLAKAAQNPVAAMISLPFQNNTLFGVGPDDDVANVLNIQPVIPITVGDWNIINRTIAPLIYLPDVTQGLPELPEGVNSGSTFGLGDINTSFYFSPAKPGAIIWGVGPSLTIPTATDENIGSEKWSAGPAAVVLAQPGPWVVGSLVRQLWSFAGDGDRQDVSQLLIQPFVNYNMADGWYLVSAPIITANWEADSDNRWTVPVGGGFGKIFKIGDQPINAQLSGFRNVEHPQYGPEWSMRLQIQFLFPK